MTAMPQVVFMAIGLTVLTFVIAFLFRKWQRAILWAVALLLFVGTSILLGTVVLKIYENGMMNHAVLLGITLAYACSFIFIYGAEKLHKALRQNCSTSETSIAQPVQVVDEELVQRIYFLQLAVEAVSVQVAAAPIVSLPTGMARRKRMAGE